MTGRPLGPAEHYLEAERLLEAWYYEPAESAALTIARAHVHAVLATVSDEVAHVAEEVWADRRDRDAEEKAKLAAEAKGEARTLPEPF